MPRWVHCRNRKRPMSKGPSVTIEYVLVRPSSCLLNIQLINLWCTFWKTSALSTVDCSMPVSARQNSESTGFITGRQYSWKISTISPEAEETRTAGNSMISCL